MQKQTLSIILFLILCNFSFAELRIGWIDSHTIMNNFEEVRQVQVDLEKEQRKLENEMNDLIASLDSLKQNYERQRLLMSDSRRQEKENELRSLEQNVQKFQMEKFGPEGEIYRKQNVLLKPVLAKIDDAIKAVASEQGYDYILERQLKPEARKDVIKILKDLNIKPSSMIDVSDGIASDILHICNCSKVGCMLYEEKIPIDTSTY